MIIGISSNNAFNHVAPKRTGDGLALVPLSSGEKVSEGPPQQSSISILARQLGESAARAELRDGQLDRRQLGMEAERLLSQILGDIYQAEKPLTIKRCLRPIILNFWTEQGKLPNTSSDLTNMTAM